MFVPLDTIVSEGEVMDSINFILRGCVLIKTRVGILTRTVSERERGDFFGEECIVTAIDNPGKTVPAQLGLIRASSYCEVLTIDVNAYLHTINLKCCREIKMKLTEWHDTLRASYARRRAQIRWKGATWRLVVYLRSGSVFGAVSWACVNMEANLALKPYGMSKQRVPRRSLAPPDAAGGTSLSSSGSKEVMEMLTRMNAQMESMREHMEKMETERAGTARAMERLEQENHEMRQQLYSTASR
jgi:hypothetical protein